MKIRHGVFFWGIAVIALLLVLPPSSTAKTIELKAVSFLPKINYVTWGLTQLVEKVNERAGGQLKISFLGGPEVIPGEDLAEAVRKGVVQVAALPGAYARGLVPEANVMHLSQYDPWEERERGFNATMIDVFKKMNAYYLGRCGDTNEAFFNFFTNKKVDRPQELKGQRAGSYGMTAVANNALGMRSVQMAIPEVYSAVERNMIDAYALPYQSAVAFGLQEVTKHLIEPGFFRSPAVILMNLDAWNSLPENLQDLVTKVQMETERGFMNTASQVRAKTNKALLAGGVKVITFSPEDTKWYLEQIYKTGWGFLGKSIKAESFNEFRKLISK